jgi:hypothetical protein
MNGRLWRLGGAALVGGSVLLAAVEVVLRLTGGADGDDPTNPVNIAAHGVGMLAGLLLIVGLPTLIAALGTRAPWLSVAGFVLLTAAILVYEIAIGLLDTVVLPYLAANHLNPTQPPAAMFPFFMGGGFAQIIGNVLLGISILRTGLFSRISGILLIAAGVILLVTLAPLPEWVDTISALAMLSGLGLVGAQLAGIPAGWPATRRASPAASLSA